MTLKDFQKAAKLRRLPVPLTHDYNKQNSNNRFESFHIGEERNRGDALERSID
jgi:hypothetical protein